MMWDFCKRGGGAECPCYCDSYDRIYKNVCLSVCLSVCRRCPDKSCTCVYAVSVFIYMPCAWT